MEQAALAGQEDSLPNGSNGDGGDGSSNSGGDGDSLAEDASEGQSAADGDGAPLPEKAEIDSGWREGVVQSGDNMSVILQRIGLGASAADEIIRAIDDHLDLRRIRPGQTYLLEFDEDGRAKRFEFHVQRTLTIIVERDAAGQMVGRREEAITETRVEAIGGSIQSSLYATVKAIGEEGALVAFFVDVFAYDLNFFTDTRKGDSFRMLVEKEYLGGDFLRYRRVLAAEYSGKAGQFQAFWWHEPGTDEGRYFDAKGQSVEKSLLKTPLKFVRISSKFDPNRMHPVLHKRRKHLGVDYAAPEGTPVWAAASGRIVYRGRRGGAGNCVIMRHDNGLQTVYMHLSRFRKGQGVGDRVKSKTVIGYVGSTGLATGPHLHFGVKQNGRYIDPLRLKPTRTYGIARKHRPQFNADVQPLVDRLRSIPLQSGAVLVHRGLQGPSQAAGSSGMP